MRQSTPEETTAHAARVAQLCAGSVEDQVVAILMDSEIGGFGLFEDYARSKGQTIFWSLTLHHTP